MTVDNILSVSVSVLGIDLSLSLCWLSIAVSVECVYGDGFLREFWIGTRYKTKYEYDAYLDALGEKKP